jgi:hypothetical protein
MFSLTLLVYFFPDRYTLRAYKELSPFMALVIANSVYHIGRLAVKASDYFSRRHIKRLPPVLSPIYLGLTLILVIPSLVFPVYNRFSFKPPGSQYYSLMADYEYEIAEWLEDHVAENVTIISDYRTMATITPLANKIWTTDKAMNVQDLTEEDQKKITHIKEHIFLAPNPQTAYYATRNLTIRIPWFETDFIEATRLAPSKLIIILSTRTEKWLEQDGIGDINFPQYGGLNSKYLQNFYDKRYFRLIKNIDDEIYTFEVQ